MRSFRARLTSLWGRAVRGARPDRGAEARDPLGPAGERAAARHLRRAGYRIVGRNLRLRPGEIDLLALDPQRRTLVVVEVKCRRCAGPAHADHRPASPPPEASVTAAKRRKLLALARAVSARQRWRRLGVRIDIVGVEWPASGEPVVRHHVNAVTR